MRDLTLRRRVRGKKKGADLLVAGAPGGSFLGNAMGALALLEAEKMAVAMLLALGAESVASLAEIGFRRIPMLALPPAAAGSAAAGVPASFPMEGMGRLADLGSGGRLALDKAAQLLSKLHIARLVFFFVGRVHAPPHSAWLSPRPHFPSRVSFMRAFFRVMLRAREAAGGLRCVRSRQVKGRAARRGA